MHSAGLQRRTVPFVGALALDGAVARKKLRKAARKARHEFSVKKEMMLKSSRSRRVPLRKKDRVVWKQELQRHCEVAYDEKEEDAETQDQRIQTGRWVIA